MTLKCHSTHPETGSSCLKPSSQNPFGAATFRKRWVTCMQSVASNPCFPSLTFGPISSTRVDDTPLLHSSVVQDLSMIFLIHHVTPAICAPCAFFGQHNTSQSTVRQFIGAQRPRMPRNKTRCSIRLWNTFRTHDPNFDLVFWTFAFLVWC